MKCPICDFISSDLETHSKFHVEGMDFMADKETLPKKKDVSRPEVPVSIVIMLCLWYHGENNLPLQRSYIL